MTLLEEVLAGVPEQDQEDLVQEAIDACDLQIRRHLANIMPGRSVADVLRMARERNARAIISFDTSLPNGLRFELVPIAIPAFLRESARPAARRRCEICSGEGYVGDAEACETCFGTGDLGMPS